MLSRTHRMTLDEASMILNIKKGAIVEESELQQMLKVSLTILLLGLGGIGADEREGHRTLITCSQPTSL